MARRPLIAGNWKMHGDKASVDKLLLGIKSAHKDINAELAVFPPYVFLDQTERALAGTDIRWGAQDVCSSSDGAFTGEISAFMLKEFGCTYVILGHSERRTLYAEGDGWVAAKFVAAIENNITPILCVGETEQQREAGFTADIILRQLDAVLEHKKQVSAFETAVIAYEPVWAIGTGKTATPDIAQEVHHTIREHVAKYDKAIADGVRILYGGSVKPGNAEALFSMPDIDGGLVGGASLDAETFLEIARSV